MLEDSDYLYDRVVEINDKLEEFPTLRDQFAMHTYSEICRDIGFRMWSAEYKATLSYEQADAMLKAREVKEVNNGD